MPYFNKLPEGRAEIARKHGVLVLSQWQVVSFYPPPNASLIRISGWNPTGITSLEPLVHGNRYVDTLALEFDDVTYKKHDHSKIFGENEAEKLYRFFTNYNCKIYDCSPTLVIHCQGGISRSSAVACGYAYSRSNKELEQDIRESGWAHPNKHVYSEMVKYINKARNGGQ